MVTLADSLSSHPLHEARLIPAMVTPFAADGSVDEVAVGRLANYLLAQQQCDAILVNGTTGESPTTSLDEKIRILTAVKQAVPQDTVVMTGAGGNNTAQTITDSQAMVATGADALLIVVPYYNKPSQAGMVAHFSAVAQANPAVPIMIYNIPGRTGSTMAPETMATLHQQCPNIVGVKQSLACMETVTQITRLLPKTFTVWSGDDPITLPMLGCGAKGVVSVLAHVAGPAIQSMMSAYSRGDVAEAHAIHLELLPLAQGLFTLPNPTIVKALLAALPKDSDGYCPATYRLPMLAATDEEAQRLITPLQPVIAAIQKHYSVKAASCV